MEFVDTHCHLNHREFADDRAAVLDRASQAGVTRLLVIGYDQASSRAAVELTSLPGVSAVIGIHPESAEEWGSDIQSEFSNLASNPENRVVAYGEIGLDYHWETIPRDRQQTVFSEQIAFAASLSPSLPLIIHCREAQDDILSVLRDSQTKAPVVMHCFTGDAASARACLDAGYWLGIGGVSTFKKADAVREAISYAPMDRILLETDCPYLAPQSKRGKRNEPSYLPEVAAIVAAVKGLLLSQIAEITTFNAISLFGL